ncbi:MAG: type II secretion system protein J [Cyanobacteriota bacterium]|jgi:hypothetical protein
MKNRFIFSLVFKSANRGFTLIELIAASIMTIFIVGAAGFGMIVMMRENLASTAGGEVQYNTNRALDFITEEARAATTISTNLVTPVTLSAFTSASGAPANGTYTAILALNGINGSSNPVIYYIRQNNSSTWIGDQIIYRWGPPLDGSGGYGTGSWTHEALIDLVASTPLNSNCINTGWTKIPSSSPKGFFACVRNDGKMAEIRISSSAVSSLGGILGGTPNTSSRYYDKATYEAVAQVFARSSAGVALTLTSSNLAFTEPAKATLSTTGTCAFPLTIEAGTTDISWSSTANNPTTTIYPSTSSPISIKQNGTSTAMPATSATSNQGTLVSGSCTVNITLNTP